MPAFYIPGYPQGIYKQTGGSHFTLALNFLKSERWGHECLNVTLPYVSKQLRRSQRVILEPHKGIGNVAHHCCFSRGEVFKYLFSSRVQLKVCCLTAHCHGCQHSFREGQVWLVDIKTPLSKALGRSQQYRFGLRCFK